VRRARYRSLFGTPFVTSAQKQTFINAVKAFNAMGNYYYNWAACPLWNYLSQDVVVYNVQTDTGKANGIQDVMNYFYNTIVLLNNTYTGPTFNPFYYSNHQPDYSLTDKIKGEDAYWVDTDGTQPDTIAKYTFKFKGNLLSVLRARDA
jgi:hypothetical protein